jgi:GNAT superfamily N-acetyltransferase
MTAGAPCVELLARRDVPAATAALAAAFADYALVRALAPDPGRRPAVAEAFCRLLVRYSIRHGTAYATADRAGVACWLPPGREWLSTVALVREGALGLLWHLGWRSGRTFLRLTDTIDAERKRLHPGRHWYLNLLGVAPGGQGRGLSRAVLRPVFETADRDRVPCYLETQCEVNVAIYRRFGFEVVGDVELAPGLRNWAMVRPPAG